MKQLKLRKSVKSYEILSKVTKICEKLRKSIEKLPKSVKSCENLCTIVFVKPAVDHESMSLSAHGWNEL